MNRLLQLEPITTAPRTSGEGRECMYVYAGLLTDAIFGTSAWVPAHGCWESPTINLTTRPISRQAIGSISLADEVRALRTRILSYGLTKQAIARAVGVDRRSLSGWTTGEIRPARERIQLLHLLEQLCADIDAQRPRRVRDVLLSRHAGTALIDRLTMDGSSLLLTWQLFVRPQVSVTVSRASRAGRATHLECCTTSLLGRRTRPADAYRHPATDHQLRDGP